MKIFPVRFTTRLQLIEIKEEHRDAIFDTMSREEVMKYYGREPMKTLDEAAEIIAHFQMLFQSGRGFRWGIKLKKTNEFIGTIGIHNYSPFMKRAEVGFEIHPDHWRKGYLTETLSSILEYCFVDLGLHRIGAITFPANEASNQLLEKLGFVQEGVLRGYLFQRGKSHDANVLSLLKPEWRRRRYKDDAPVAYRDHLTEIVKRSEKAGDFDQLTGKGKPLDLGPSYVNPSEAQLYKTLKDNHVLPDWIELANEIDVLKEKLMGIAGEERRELVQEINEKIKAYNLACPPSLQRNIVRE